MVPVAITDKVNSFPSYLYHDEYDDHPLESRVVFVVEVLTDQLHQLTAVGQLLIHHLFNN